MRPQCIVLCALFFVVPFFSLAEINKYPDPTAEDFAQKSCPIDSTAGAYYIFDEGDFRIEFGARKNIQQRFQRHYRIHILNSSQFDLGNVVLNLYGTNMNRESIFTIRGSVFNLESGQVVETKWDKKELMYEDINDSYQRAKLALPRVKEGSIIDVEFVIVRENAYFIKDWYFQKDIPVLVSNYSVDIPEFFEFKTLIAGYYNIEEKSDVRNERISMDNVSANGYNYKVYKIGYSSKNLQAFVERQWLFSRSNYLAHIEFDLMWVRLPYDNPVSFTKTWVDVAELFMQDDRFGKKLNKQLQFRDMAKGLVSSGKKDEALLLEACSAFSQKMKWDGSESFVPNGQLQISYAKGSGNSADVNLNLLLLMRELGFVCNPVLLSTQENGYVHETYPSLDCFDYVISEVIIGESSYLLDATSNVIEPNLLPKRCLNGTGFVLNPQNYHWVDLLGKSKYAVSTKYELNYDPQQNAFSGVYKKEHIQMAKPEIRKDMSAGLEDYLKSMKEDFPGLEVSDCTFDSLDIRCNKITENAKFNLKERAVVSDENIIFPVALIWGIQENPLESDQRDYPVEMSYPYKIYDMAEITIPDGYVVQQLPKTTAVQTADNSNKFSLTVMQEGTKIKVVSSFSVNRLFYEPEEYSTLRDFFKRIVELEHENIILKKAS